MKSSTNYLTKISPENCCIHNQLYPKPQLSQSRLRISRSPSFNAFISHPLPWKRVSIQVSSPSNSAMDAKKGLRNLHATGEATGDQLKTVHVKFLLQKDCCFGEQIMLVGNVPNLGSWDPLNAVPLNWSEGDIWFVELDVPVEHPIQFKFLLRQSSEDLLWQPGPDRAFQTWDTENILAVAEDWDNAEAQTITEEARFNDPISKPDSKPVTANAGSEDTASTETERGMNVEDYNDEEALFTQEVEFPVLVPGLPPTAAK